MAYDNRDRLIALAGLFQAVACVHRIARTGNADSAVMEPCIYSLLQVDAADVSSVYGPPGAVANGARQIVAQLTGKPERDLQITRYAVSAIKLERTLFNRPDVQAQIGEGVKAAEAKLEHFPLLHPNMLAHFAEIYSETLSQLSPRIMVRGDSTHLRNPDNQSRIRALLLAAVRSAMLWRQVGGGRLQLLFGQKRVLQEARLYLDQAGTLRPADSASQDGSDESAGR